MLSRGKPDILGIVVLVQIHPLLLQVLRRHLRRLILRLRHPRRLHEMCGSEWKEGLDELVGGCDSSSFLVFGLLSKTKLYTPNVVLVPYQIVNSIGNYGGERAGRSP